MISDKPTMGDLAIATSKLNELMRSKPDAEFEKRAIREWGDLLSQIEKPGLYPKAIIDSLPKYSNYTTSTFMSYVLRTIGIEVPPLGFHGYVDRLYLDTLDYWSNVPSANITFRAKKILHNSESILNKGVRFGVAFVSDSEGNIISSFASGGFPSGRAQRWLNEIKWQIEGVPHIWKRPKDPLFILMQEYKEGKISDIEFAFELGKISKGELTRNLISEVDIFQRSNTRRITNPGVKAHADAIERLKHGQGRERNFYQWMKEYEKEKGSLTEKLTPAEELYRKSVWQPYLKSTGKI